MSLLHLITLFAYLAGCSSVTVSTYDQARRISASKHDVVYVVHNNSSNNKYGFPSEADYIVERQAYTLGYMTNFYQSAWVCYSLTRSNVLNRAAKRRNNFRPDPILGKYSSTLQDYRHSGYDRGHLCPAADVAWSSATMSESFYLSNMSPQVGPFNRGIWKDLEQWVRDIAVHVTNVYVYTGPVLDTNLMLGVVGPNRVTVPGAYYKVILDENEPKRAIGFILPNKANTNSYLKYIRSVRDVETVTGLDFFSILSTNEQDRIETTVETNHWILR